MADYQEGSTDASNGDICIAGHIGVETRCARLGVDNPLLAFVHVPKTAGTSLQMILQGTLMNARPVFNVHRPDQARAFLEMSAEDRDNHYGVFGHMPFGVDRHVDRPVIYITFLRDPVERVLSAYAHCLRHQDEPGAAEVARRGIAWTAQPSNAMLARLADDVFVQEPDDDGCYVVTDPCDLTEAHVERAKANLERCAFIGLYEHYEEDIRQLTDLRGHRILVPALLPREKTGSNRLRQSDLTPAQLQAIRTANELDQELYDYAVKLRAQWGGPIRPDCRRQERWRTLSLKWRQNGGSGAEGVRPMPTRFATPATAWHYGAVSEVLPLEGPALVRIGAKALAGQSGLCLLSEDVSSVLSEARQLSLGADAEVVYLTVPPGARGRLCVRTHDGSETNGEVELQYIEYLESEGL